MEKKLLPLGVHSFRKIRKNGFYYVDKTQHIDWLMQEGSSNFFLSRPRRFGKTLFIDTLKEAFEGSKELFKGLALSDKWDWSSRSPVVRLDLNGGNYTIEGELVEFMESILGEIEDDFGLEKTAGRPAVRLKQIIRKLYDQSGQEVVFLVDEYDKPIVDALEYPDMAIANRNELRAIFSILKHASTRVCFSFFTGVTRFSKTSLFSGVNNLRDLTLSPRYSAICGYTDLEIEHVFGQEIEDIDRDKMRRWYNGYSWLGSEKVYNPYDVLNLFVEGTFKSWWFETGTPTFLTNIVQGDRVYSIDTRRKMVRDSFMSNFDVGRIDITALLFQTGYLTIVGEEVISDVVHYYLDYPNFEVRHSLNYLLEGMLLPEVGSDKQAMNSNTLIKLLEEHDKAGLENHFRSLMACIPHHWYDNSQIAQYEAHCASVFYSHLLGTGADVRAEDSTNWGRADLTVVLKSRVYVMEFKVSEKSMPGTAMEQARKKEYAEKYRRLGLPITLVGIEYSSAERNIVKFQMKRG